jgi:hypothetical protein
MFQNVDFKPQDQDTTKLKDVYDYSLDGRNPIAGSSACTTRKINSGSVQIGLTVSNHAAGLRL